MNAQARTAMAIGPHENSPGYESCASGWGAPVLRLLGPVFLLVLCGHPGAAQDAGISWYKFGSGGGASSGGDVTITGSIGQPAAGPLGAGEVAVYAGFWSHPTVVLPPGPVITWTNLAGGNWTDRLNWSPNKVPTAAEVAAVTLPGTYTVTLNYDASCLALVLGGEAGTQSVNWSYGGFSGNMIIEANAVVNLVGSSISLDGTIENRGRINWPAGQHTWRFNEDSKLLNYPGGLVDLQGNGSFYSGTSAARLILNAGTVRKSIDAGRIMVYPGFTVCNGGLLDIQSGTLGLNGLQSSNTVSVASGAVLQLVAGTYDFLPGHTFAGAGTWWLDGSPSVNGTLNGDVRFTVSGAGNMNARVDASMWWTNGDLKGNLTIGSAGQLELSTMAIYGTLTNYGRIHWPARNWTWYPSARFENMPGAVFDLAFDATLYGPPGAVFRNSGTFLKSAGTGLASMRGPNVYTNLGTIDIRAGTLEVANGFASSGSINVAPGAELSLIGGNCYFGPTHKFTGTGACTFGGGSLYLNGPLDGTVNFEMVYGAAFDCTVNAPLSWTYGNASGNLTVGANGMLTLVAPGSLSGTLVNRGTVIWPNPYASWDWASNSRLDNFGLFDMQGDSRFYARGTQLVFNNAGTFRKSAGTAAGVFDADFSFSNSGNVEVQTGELLFRGPYRQTTSGRTVVYLGGITPLTGYTQIEFDQAPALAGRFSAFTKGGYRPAPGTQFIALSYPSVSGNFELYDLDLGGGLTLSPVLGPTALTLKTLQSTAPSLAISLKPGALRITWPEGFTGWHLYSATNLINPKWELVPIVGGTTIELPTTKPQEMFRLGQP